MKKIILLLSLFICSRALAQTGNLIVFTEQGEKMWVILNGVKQNQTAQTNVKVTGLNAPNYTLKVIFEDKTIPDLDKTVYMSQPDIGQAGEYTYAIKKKDDGKYVLRFRGAVAIAQAAPPAQGQSVIVYGAAPAAGTVTQQTTTTTTTTGTDADNVNMNVGMNVNGMGVGMNVNVNDPNMNSSTTVTQQTTTTTTTTSGGYSNGYNDPAPAQQAQVEYVPGYRGACGCPAPMDAGSFTSAKESIANSSFENTKQDMAKSIINSHCFTTDQVVEILSLFDFENTKLDMAKYAYTHTYDKGNYFKVSNVFTFDNSKSELSKYISSH